MKLILQLHFRTFITSSTYHIHTDNRFYIFKFANICIKFYEHSAQKVW